MTNNFTSPNPHSEPVLQIPDVAWSRAIGLGWEQPYRVRYASNIDDGPWHGMPLGGLGAGCIGRSHRGDFNLWHLDGGEHFYRSMPDCQFSLFEQVGDADPQAYALTTDSTLAAWSAYPGGGDYHALYPRSWFQYRDVFETDLTCEQFSPILPQNYRESSYPLTIFLWTAHNPTDQPVTLSIMLSWQNMVGWFTNALKSPEVKLRDDGSPVYDYQPRLESRGNSNHWVDGAGCVMNGRRSSPIAEGEGQLAIVSDPSLETFYHMRWNPQGDGSDLWNSFAQDGSLPNIADETPAGSDEQIGVAIAVRLQLAPGETQQIPVVLAWDLPVTEFAEGVQYFRRYTDFFGRTGDQALQIAQAGLVEYPTWQAQIQQWQQPILERADLPDWFKMALFNELYDLCSGGSLWSAASERDPVGQFAVLECLDYRWYESLDVRLYGSFALLHLFPDLDKAIMRAFARAIPAEDSHPRTIGYYYTIGKPSPQARRKAQNATPHDLGAPNEHVWEKTNYTSYQDCNLWKDLGSDFVLLVYRDFVLTGSRDFEFLTDCWDAVVATLDYLKGFDLDGDGIPENSGAPDQTFDDWRLQGISAYCGGLWIAALEAAIAMGQVLTMQGTDSAAPMQRWQDWLAQSRAVYHQTLWNGSYYRLDSQSGSQVVMADQLCGQFYARLLGLPDVVAPEYAESALRTVYNACFLKFHGGQFGAANGLLPDGSPLNPQDTHPLEVWIGINFGLAAFLLQMGMRSEALRITESVVRQVYHNGLQFRTPEAITAAGTFRASHYLRAMAIWAVFLGL